LREKEEHTPCLSCSRCRCRFLLIEEVDNHQRRPCHASCLILERTHDEKRQRFKRLSTDIEWINSNAFLSQGYFFVFVSFFFASSLITMRWNIDEISFNRNTNATTKETKFDANEQNVLLFIKKNTSLNNNDWFSSRSALSQLYCSIRTITGQHWLTRWIREAIAWRTIDFTRSWTFHRIERK
jgi:hypothetical protein